jgi:hypothetical protein
MNIAAINFLPMHYEMYGYIINYCYYKNGVLQRKNNKEDLCVSLTIYTGTINNYKWLDFYESHFKNKLNFNFEYKDLNLVEKNLNSYDCIFIPTDDDPNIKPSWITSENINKFICFQHYYLLRNPIYKNYITLRPYDNSKSPFVNWALPCYPIVNIEEKNNILKNKENNDINILILGGIREKYNHSVINRIFSLFNKKIVIHIIATYLKSEHIDLLRSSLSEHITLQVHKGGGMDTCDMVNIVKNCDAVLLDVTSNADHIDKSMSGCIPLAFSCLTPLIISTRMNAFYKFKNVIEYDQASQFPIFLSNNFCDLDNLYLERQQLILKFSNYVDSCIDQNVKNEINTALIVEPRKLVDLQIVINKFKQVLGDNWKIVFYCGANDTEFWINKLKNYKGDEHQLYDLLDSVEIRELKVNDLNSNEYNDLLKQKNLWRSLYGKYVLVFQSDTWLSNDNKYNIDYFTGLNKSYIGGNTNYPWRELIRENFKPTHCNFNGGLSLRIRYDMIKIIDSFPPEPTQLYSSRIETDAEDVYFTLGCHKLNLPLGDDEESCRFAIHTLFYDGFFGIHRPPRILSDILLNVCPDIFAPYVLNR